MKTNSNKNKEFTIVNWGAYDIDNLGDLLFPYMIDYIFKDYNLKIIHVSPTGRESHWKDAYKTLKISEAIKHKNIIGLIIGGGNLISWTKSLTEPYGNNVELSEIVHPSFFYIPYILKVKYGIPYVFNLIGVSKPIPESKRLATKKIIDASSFISCRDKNSSNRLLDAGVKSKISVGLDSVFYIDKVFSKSRLVEYYNLSVKDKYNISDKKFAVIYIKKKYLNNQYNEILSIVKILISNRIHPVFIPLSLCFKDELILEDEIFNNINATIIKNPKSILEILSILSKADIYIGSSLHGGIVSLSYGNKIAIIADEDKSQIKKISGFLQQVDLSDSLFKTWLTLNETLIEKGVNIFKTVDKEILNKHYSNNYIIWNNIYNKLINSEKTQKNPELLNDSLIQNIAEFYKI